MALTRFLAAFVSLILALAGCESELPSGLYDFLRAEHADELIPLGKGNVWTYQMKAYNSYNDKDTVQTVTELNSDISTSNVDHPINIWDSSERIWVSGGTGQRFRHYHGAYFEGNGLVYTPYHEGDEKGLLCGYGVWWDTIGYYWFKLPRKPLRPLQFTAPTFVFPNSRDTLQSSTAGLDTTLYRIAVPAGRYDCYRLILTTTKVDRSSIAISTDTLYLAPGTGMVKSDYRRNYYVIDSLDGKKMTVYYLLNYELTSWTHQ